ncbi:carbon storage regulator [Acidilutibacter cellobiosedens]|jgi:carbon storage regulator|uniref:Translational regulator CsrA n=1 Tax=Acidilutibacter cellobiosedens TaxID=2507161 RepID=A0A410Q9N5_9FIRM|nr:carbon storage regulator CsrA [Acidilutibacter cellobiosedens]MBE6081783.1 carbon storage regulator CsrA [Tissierellaceae bacterium]QAT60690.1 carbon storage regulator [Acidilutibacter cellobiosedens]
MLILTRKKDESILIGKNIKLKIISIEEGKVKIGIEAPKDVEILRKELLDTVEKENISAAESNMDLDKLKDLIKK